VLADVGPFAGIGVAEDRDWGRRATAKGYRIRFVPGMKVYHPARARFAELAQKWERQTAHDYADACLRPRGRLRFVLKTLVMPLSPLAQFPQILMTARLPGLGSRAMALVCLIRVRLLRARLMAQLVMGGKAERMSGMWNRG
jgi:hypothetical protein